MNQLFRQLLIGTGFENPEKRKHLIFSGVKKLKFRNKKRLPVFPFIFGEIWKTTGVLLSFTKFLDKETLAGLGFCPGIKQQCCAKQLYHPFPCPICYYICKKSS